MILETVRSALSADTRQSVDSLKRTSGIDESTLTLVIGLLVRWNFAETRKIFNLQIRRKPDAFSPVEDLDVLQSLAANPPPHNPDRQWSAERVACRACGHRNFHFVEENQVECDRCGEKQWYKIEFNKNREAPIEVQAEKK